MLCCCTYLLCSDYHDWDGDYVDDGDDACPPELFSIRNFVNRGCSAFVCMCCSERLGTVRVRENSHYYSYSFPGCGGRRILASNYGDSGSR